MRKASPNRMWFGKINPVLVASWAINSKQNIKIDFPDIQKIFSFSLIMKCNIIPKLKIGSWLGKYRKRYSCHNLISLIKLNLIKKYSNINLAKMLIKKKLNAWFKFFIL